MEDYPEHEKMKAVMRESQDVGEFLDWLAEEGWSICECEETRQDSFYLPIILNTEQVLAKYFEIDLRKIEQEKQAMLK